VELTEREHVTPAFNLIAKLVTNDFRFEPLGPQHYKADYAA
jgi:hypothetical protein